jgi:ribonuclease E
MRRERPAHHRRAVAVARREDAHGLLAEREAALGVELCRVRREEYQRPDARQRQRRHAHGDVPRDGRREREGGAERERRAARGPRARRPRRAQRDEDERAGEQRRERRLQEERRAAAEPDEEPRPPSGPRQRPLDRRHQRHGREGRGGGPEQQHVVHQERREQHDQRTGERAREVAEPAPRQDGHQHGGRDAQRHLPREHPARVGAEHGVRQRDQVRVERLLVERPAAEPAVPQRPRGIARRRRVAGQRLRRVGMRREVGRGELAVPGMGGVERAIGQPVAARDVAPPAVEEGHVGLRPLVLREERPAVQLDEEGGADECRGERHGGHDDGAATREPALGPIDRRESWRTLGHARGSGHRIY